MVEGFMRYEHGHMIAQHRLYMLSGRGCAAKDDLALCLEDSGRQVRLLSSDVEETNTVASCGRRPNSLVRFGCA